MPKNKKPAAGRAQSFDPRYAKKRSTGSGERRFGAPAGKPGSKSPGHRGYRPESEGDAKKARWSAQEKAGRAEARGIRGRGRGDGETPRDTRGSDHRDGGYRPRSAEPRSGYRDGERRAYRQDVDGRGNRNDRDDRSRGFRQDRDDRGHRPNRDDRGYGQNRDDRPRDDRAYGQNRDDRGYRQNRDDRPRGFRQDRDDRGFRQDRDNRGYRQDRDERRPHDGDRAERNHRDVREGGRPRYERSERPRFDGDRTERPRFDRDRGERPRFDRDRSDRPRFDRDRSDHPRFDRDRRDDRGARDTQRDHRTAAEQADLDTVHERLGAESVTAEATEGVTFGDLGLGDNIVRALADLGAPSPFPIQAAVIPPILEGRDVLGRGRTGSGKTIAFGAPLVESLLRARAGSAREFGRSPQAIILAPTRELALQIDRTVQPIARSVGLFTTQIYGGVPQARQVGALKKGVDIIIGTPGRIEDLHEQGKLDLSQIRIAVLDEADHMSELGFLEPMQRILRLVPKDAQKLLLSATLDGEVATLVDEFLVNPAVYEVADENQDTGTIEHRVLVIDHRNKPEILNSLVDRDGKTLVFTRTRAYAEMLAEQFQDEGIPAVALHGDLNQAKRTRNLQRLTDGKVRVLVATDVAARGIHVDDIDLVVQADAPDEYKTYLHRSGRTGRAGRSGTVATIVSRARTRRMRELLERAEIDAPFEDVRPGDDLLEEVTGRQLDPVS